MFSYFYTLCFSNNPDRFWLRIVILFAILMVCILFYKRQNLAPYYEGFSQDKRFVMKQNNDIYDEFYVSIYDRLMQTDNRARFEVERVIQMTQPSIKRSVFLDIGSGTGHLVQSLQDLGYEAYGIDKSQSMVNAALKKAPDLPVKCGDIHEPMTYDKGAFTHILCTGLTFYQMEQKIDFLRNCFYWLMPGGYLILHLVDREKFDTIIPAGKPPLLSSPQQYAKQRITDTIIDFIDFEYKASWQSNHDTMVLKETFTDELTKNIRQNEMTYHMEPLSVTLAMIRRVGFIVQGQVDMSSRGDPYQYYYILERPQ
jgi:SAM-dependent methyltransferase